MNRTTRTRGPRSALGLLGPIAAALWLGCAPDLQLGQPGAQGAGGAGAGGAGVGGSGGQAGQGGDGAGGAPLSVIESWTAGPPGSTGEYALPGWLVLDSPSVNKTVQTGPDTVRTGFGANAARARRVDTAWGLSVESERTNRQTRSRVDTWMLAYLGSTALTTGPDGVDMAVEVTDIDNQFQTAISRGMQAAVGETATLSAWVADITPGNQASIECNSMPNSIHIPPQNGWRRVSLTDIEDANQPLDRFRPAAVDGTAMGSAKFDLVNHETGKYPSSVIVSVGTTETRLAERLYINNADAVAPGGWFHVVTTIAPNYAASEQDFDHDLLYFDDMNRVYVRAVDHAVAMVAGGAEVLSTSALDWAREQEMTIEVKNLPGVRTIDVVGANGPTLSVSNTTPVPFPAVSTLYLLGSSVTGAQECADLRSITFYEPM